MLKVILIALLLSACGGSGQDNKQGTTEAKAVNCQDFDALSAAVITAAAEQQLAKEGKE